MEAQPRQQPGASPSSARPDVAERARRPAAAAAARRQQAPPPAQEPVLQSAGYGASGGIQVGALPYALDPVELWSCRLQRRSEPPVEVVPPAARCLALLTASRAGGALCLLGRR